jgi:hypothetical protein
MSTRNISWRVKAAGAYGCHPYHLHVLIVWIFWEAQPPGALRACPRFNFNKKKCINRRGLVLHFTMASVFET